MKHVCIFAVVLSLLCLVVAGCGGSSEGAAMVPDCHPKKEKCHETSDGYLIPFWYYLVLFNTQGTRNVTISEGKLPSVSDEEEANAPEEKIEQAATEDSENESVVPSEDEATPESPEEFSPPSESEPEESSPAPEESEPSESFSVGGEE